MSLFCAGIALEPPIRNTEILAFLCNSSLPHHKSVAIPFLGPRILLIPHLDKFVPQIAHHSASFQRFYSDLWPLLLPDRASDHTFSPPAIFDFSGSLGAENFLPAIFPLLLPGRLCCRRLRR